MLKDRIKLENHLFDRFDKVTVKKELCDKLYEIANQQYNMPKELFSDYITSRKSLAEASEFELFIMMDTLINSKEVPLMKKISDFYTKQEVSYYRRSKYVVEKIQFPLVFKMVPVTADQWIGTVDVKTLMKLRKAQLINYNTNAQRVMDVLVKNGKEVYKISINQSAVKEISASYENETYIPNPITLNIPAEQEADFYYDESTCELVIKSLNHFDISDGYHRYVAACKCSDRNENFNYPMEFRIVNWYDAKAQTFIAQEDKKTQMRKLDSKSMDMNMAANIVVTRLNENVNFNLKGMVTRNRGLIPFAELAALVHYFYFKDLPKSKIRITTMTALKELTSNFNMLTEYNMSYMENRMSYRTLLAAMTCFNYYKVNDLDRTDMCEVIEKVAKMIIESKDPKFANKTPRKAIIDLVEKYIMEVRSDG